jgi:hypothetical protein
MIAAEEFQVGWETVWRTNTAIQTNKGQGGKEIAFIGF